MIPGIKVDRGALPMPAARTKRSPRASMACASAWRTTPSSALASPSGAASSPSPATPSRNGIRANAHALARYAMYCQEAGIVPVVEPEVLADGELGDHSIQRCEDVTGETPRGGVQANCASPASTSRGMLLKPNMVTPGLRSARARQRRGGGPAHRRNAAPLRAGRRARHRLPLGRPVRRRGDGAPQRR